MAITISRYVDPGVYIQEVTGPGSISVTSERVLVLVGVAPRTRRAINEQVVRGKIYTEVLALSASSPHISDALANKSDRSRNEATLYMNGNELGLGDWSFNSAALIGAEWGALTVDVSTIKYVTIGIDGIAPITLDLNALLLGLPVPGVPAAATGEKLVEAINVGLVAATNYGAAYVAAASWASGTTNPIITITSPDSTPLSAVRLLTSPDSSNDATALISNNAWTLTTSDGFEAPTTITVVDRAYNAAAEYTLDYQAIDNLMDPLTLATVSTELQDILIVGTYPGGVDYREGIDFDEGTNVVDWDLLSQAVATSKDLTILPVITTGVNDELSIEINESNPLLVTLPSNTAKATGAADLSPVVDSGTVDAINVGKLEDTTADFVTSLVAVGDVVQNTTDGTQALVTLVDNLTTLTLDADIFPDGDEAYSIYTPSQLDDAAATFTTNLVVVGDTVLNTTTGVQALVTVVDSETKLTLDAGIFTAGDAYTISTPQALADIATAVNAALVASPAYGVAYAFVCAVVSDTLTFTAPSPFENYPNEVGYASNIVFAATTSDAFGALFGAGVEQPYLVRGAGLRPEFGTSYYTTYDYNRPSTDYTVAHRVYDVDQLWAYTTQLTLGNYLRNAICVAGEIAFENGVNSLYLIQVNDQTVEGQPSQTQINAAIDIAEEYQLITEVVTLDTSLETAVYQMRHVSNQSSLLEKHYRRGWFGMARDTAVGDPDTPDTFVYRATQTLQPGNTSSGRGRLVLTAPGNASRVLTLDDGREVEVDLDGSYLATAVCAISTSLPGPAEVLIGKTIAGFQGESFGTYLRGERATLADNGVNVVTYDAGNFELIDPVTTENGGAKVIQFVEPSSSPQKDAVTVTVDRLLDGNVKGLVPDDLSDFISEIKKWIVLGILANINNGTIAAYRNNNGLTRDIDATTDIQVYQSSTDPRVFYFKYWYNLKYPAKWFFGEYSVDNPFFSPQ